MANNKSKQSKRDNWQSTPYGKGHNNQKIDQHIFAPFNFVPINEKVFIPKFPNRISLDIPFKDQVSGIIEFTLTAITPIFTKDSSSNPLDASFCRLPDGTYFIPATSLKGCIRSVLEILSFGKMTAVSNNKFETKDFKYNDSLTVHSVMPKALLNEKNAFKPDLAECIFGYIFEGKSLRGRMQFGHAFAVKDTAVADTNLKSFKAYAPHPSYYPIYSRNGKKWTDNDACIVGRKRYLIQKVNPQKEEEQEIKSTNPQKEEEQEIKSTTAKVHFLKKDAQFRATIRFHNLRPFELGALLSAITFHGNNERCYHNLGFGKPYGYGKVKINDIKLSVVSYSDVGSRFSEVECQPYIDEFEKVMTEFLPSWRVSPQVTELMAIAGGWNKNEGYMTPNQYRFAKKNKTEKSLNRFTELCNNYFKMPQPAGRKYNVTSNSPLRTNLSVGQEVLAKYIGDGKVRVQGLDYQIPMGIKKSLNTVDLTNKTLKVKINQISRVGIITHVSFLSLI